MALYDYQSITIVLMVTGHVDQIAEGITVSIYYSDLVWT